MLGQSGEGGNQEWKNQYFRLWESEAAEAQAGRKTMALYMCVAALKVCVRVGATGAKALSDGIGRL